MGEEPTRQSDQGFKLEDTNECQITGSPRCDAGITPNPLSGLSALQRLTRFASQSVSLGFDPNVSAEFMCASYLNVLEEYILPDGDATEAGFSARLEEEYAEYISAVERHGIPNMNTVSEIVDVMYYAARISQRRIRFKLGRAKEMQMILLHHAPSVHDFLVYAVVSESKIADYLTDVAALKFEASSLGDVPMVEDRSIRYIGQIWRGDLSLVSEYDCANCCYDGPLCGAVLASEVEGTFGDGIWQALGVDVPGDVGDYDGKIYCDHFRRDDY